MESVANSADSSSWRALREAEGLADPTLVRELVEYLNTNPGKDKRQAAYFALGELGKNLQSSECASVLLSCISKENDKYVLAGLLDRLAEIPKPASLDLKPIYQLLTDKRWLVRYSAIAALGNTESAEAEDRLLTILADSADPNDLIYCHATLNSIGTTKSISRLREGLKSRKRDVKLSAKAAIEAIEARTAAGQGPAKNTQVGTPPSRS